MEELAISSEVTQYIKIRLGDEFFGIDIKYVDNIVRMQHITRVPKAPEYIKGVINLRGEVIPVFSLRLKMGIEEIEETKSFRIIILKYEGESVGIIVDEVREVANVSSDDVEKVFHSTSEGIQNFLSGVGKTENGLISLLDINEILND
ncbi:MAG: chemotaxis protein CheW [Lachnospiraceae bacterium]|jgi:purine-binding chemotaxis protein CheW|nr:chemotaxis protein CheW [Lachnospiraceae bacterium]